MSTDDIHRDRDFSEAVANQAVAYAKLFEAQPEGYSYMTGEVPLSGTVHRFEREAMRFLSMRSSGRLGRGFRSSIPYRRYLSDIAECQVAREF